MNQAAAGDDRWERHDWWGVVIDCADVAQLTHFYAELRGWKIHHLDDKDGSLDAGEGVAYLNIQYNSDRPPRDPLRARALTTLLVSGMVCGIARRRSARRLPREP